MEESAMSETDSISFATMIQKEGKFLFVAIPFVPRAVWGARPRYRVRGSINGIAVQGTLGAFGQDYFLRVSGAWLQNSGIALGTHVDVQLSCAREPHDDGRV